MDSPTLTRKNARFITFRSLIFGLLGIFIMAGLSNFHDSVLLGSLMVGNLLPVGAFTYFFLVGCCWNGLWSVLDSAFKKNGALRDRMALSMRELICVMVVTLVASYPPTSGLYRYFHRQLLLPWYFLSGKAAWTQHELLSVYMRPELFPDPFPGKDFQTVMTTPEYTLVYQGFFTGLAKGMDTVGFAELAQNGVLGAWVKPMLYWAPFLVLLALACISLQFLVHNQWAKHEQLSYPIAQVAMAFCRTADGGHAVPLLFRNGLFWAGCIPVFFLLGLGYAHEWAPDWIPSLTEMLPNLRFWAVPLESKIPVLRYAYGSGALSTQVLFFTFLGISYFVSSEIALTVGLSTPLTVVFGLLFYSSTGAVLDSGNIDYMRGGAFIGYSLILLYTGRTYFKAVFGRALGLSRRKTADGSADDDGAAVLAARTLILAFIGFTILVAWACQNWLMAIFCSLLTMVLFLIISRLVCETGIPFLQANWNPGPMLVTLFGPAAIGPHATPFLLFSTAMTTQDPRESLMPFAATGAKLADDNGVPLKKVFWVVVAAVLLALVVGWFSTTFAMYNYNGMSDGWASRDWGPCCSYLDQAAGYFNEMKTAGVFEESLSKGTLSRLSLLACDSTRLSYIITGLVGVFALSALRFRFSKFPIHPILFLILATYPSNAAWGAFLAGWFIKQLVVRFGGGGVYMKLKPVFIGLIAGELGIAGLSIIIDFVHYLLFGTVCSVHCSFLPT